MAALFGLPGGGGVLRAVSVPAKVVAALNRVSAGVWSGLAALGVFALAAACIPRERRRQFALFVVEVSRAQLHAPDPVGRGRIPLAAASDSTGFDTTTFPTAVLGLALYFGCDRDLPDWQRPRV
jgi:hypothetical protein